MFIKEEHKNIFLQQGYIVLPLLENTDIQQLEKLYLDSIEQIQEEYPFYTSIWSENAAYRKFIYDNASLLLSNRVSKYLSDAEHIFSNLHVKKKSKDSGLIAHQDWNFVDEPKDESITVWCTLTDVDERNGALQIVPGSHRMTNYVRGRFFDAPFKNLRDTIIKDKLVTIPMKKGEAIFFHSRLIHASGPNYADENRIAASVVMVPNGTPLVHDVLDVNTGMVRRLNVKPDFFYNYSCYDELQGLSGPEEYPYQYTPISATDLDRICNQG